MDNSALGGVEKSVLGALLQMANQDMVVHTTMNGLAQQMGYKTCGGIITYALRTLEMRNYIATLSKGTYKVMV